MFYSFLLTGYEFLIRELIPLLILGAIDFYLRGFFIC
jgi:hypothetical protein